MGGRFFYGRGVTELLPFILIDIVILIAVGLFYLRQSSFFHPLSLYLFFHLYSFTLRGFELYSGKYPMYFGLVTSRYYSAVRPEEFVRALIVADIALVLFAAGCFLAAGVKHVRTAQPFDNNLLIVFLLTLLPASFYFLISRRFGGEQSELLNVQLLLMIGVWPIACIGLAVARWGFKLHWLVLAAIYMFIVGTQGYHRFMLLLPLILLVGIYLARRRQMWPRTGVWAFLVLVMLAFPVMKTFGQEYNASGATAALETATSTAMAAGDDPLVTRTEMFLDQFAGALTLADGLEAPLLGKSYLAIVTLPIPRSWWPDKPTLGETTVAIEAAGRPFTEEGRIVTLIGESYINFGYVGIALIMPLLGYLLSRFYFKAFAVSALDPYKLAYLALTTTYLQVYRDGLLSLILFSFIVGFPIYLYAFVNGLMQRARAAGATRWPKANPTAARRADHWTSPLGDDSAPVTASKPLQP